MVRINEVRRERQAAIQKVENEMTDEDARMDQVWFDGLTVDTIMKVCHFQNYWSILHLQYCYQVIF